MMLALEVVPYLAEARATLIARGVEVGAMRHKAPADAWAGGWSAGLDPKRRDYASFTDFADPDGNTWTIQERGHPCTAPDQGGRGAPLGLKVKSASTTGSRRRSRGARRLALTVPPVAAAGTVITGGSTMKKKIEVRTRLSLNRESIQLLDSGLRQVGGAKNTDGCSIVSGCFSCRFLTCTTI